MKECFDTLAREVKPGETIAMPYRIGCGLAGGDWGRVMDIMMEVFGGRNYQVILYRK